MEDMFAILIAIIFFVFLVILLNASLKAQKAKKYWAWFYNRERGLAELNMNSYLMNELTNSLLNGEGASFSGCNDIAYSHFKIANSNIFAANDVAYVNSNNGTGQYHKDNRDVNSLLSQIHVSTDGVPLDIYFATNKDGGYHFVILPDIILAFISGVERAVFVAAYDISAFSEEVSYINYQKSYDNITDMSHNDRSYFLRYCDVKDSQAIAAAWDYETKNGYRDGRRQGNNSFRVKFKYTLVKYQIGSVQANIASSRTKNAEELDAAFNTFRNSKTAKDKSSSTASSTSGNNASSQRMTNDDILSFVNGDSKKKEESNSSEYGNKAFNKDDYIDAEYREVPADEENETRETNNNIEEAIGTNRTYEGKQQIDISQRKAIREGDARARNRELMSSVTDSMNNAYGSQYEFKVYQVRKNRDNWQMQDAGSYAYFERNGCKYCIEFNLRTTLDNGVTKLEFRLSSDDAELVGSYFGKVIQKHRMFPFNNGYSVFLEYDYQYDATDEVKDKLIILTRTLAEEVL